MPLRVVLADDHQLVREALRALLEREGFAVVAEASDGRQALDHARKLQPDVIVLDLAMPGLNGLDAAKQVRQECARTKIILLTMHTEDHLVLEALQSGISGYVLKSRSAAALVTAIQEVCAGNVYLSPGISKTVVEAVLSKKQTLQDPLSPREREVLQLLAEGKRTKEIAHVLGITVKTAESHRASIMEKLDIHDTAGLVRYALRQGLVEL